MKELDKIVLHVSLWYGIACARMETQHPEPVYFSTSSNGARISRIGATVLAALLQTGLAADAGAVKWQCVGPFEGCIFATGLFAWAIGSTWPQPAGVCTNKNARLGLVLGLGGPSGAGKTTVLSILKCLAPNKFETPTVYTDRPRRPYETDGKEYRFVGGIHELRTTLFGVTPSGNARGYSYWTDIEQCYERLHEHPEKVQVLFQSRSDEIRKSRTRYPNYVSVFLSVSDDEIRERLRGRGDQDIFKSLEYNSRLDGVSEADLVIANGRGYALNAAKNILQGIHERL